ncbi:FtsK/SpoIIIE domain-containing protein [Arsenicicoccus dermatophilus]|uniref:FtsK/SpoIIIE domain-containing protein n=1 Tax=Arsenicicoccus dermatophilus TaxID=1076331 RepID=UPI003916CF31
MGGPLRRFGWRRVVRRDWRHLCESSGWARVRAVEVPAGVVEPGTPARIVAVPRLRRVTTRGAVVSLVIRARHGQTLDELEAGVPRLASTLGAVTYAPRQTGASCSVLAVDLVMADHLDTPTTTPAPTTTPMPYGRGLVIGRTQTAAPWRLDVLGRHTLVVGCSGSGKGSILWGIVTALAPAVPSDCVRLWGIDLKRGVELSMGAGLFSARAFTTDDALAVLRDLVAVIEERGDRMAGVSRLHQPKPGDPLHVLVIDELAALLAYADADTRRDAERLLALILTQGRALGVSVVACVQDPRKETVKLRGLFTQTVALRLRSSMETVMVLGEGKSHRVPAHRISPAAPGTCWVIDDEGNATRARAHYWPDDAIRAAASCYPTRVHAHLVPAPDAAPQDSRDDQGDEHDTVTGTVVDEGSTYRVEPTTSAPSWDNLVTSSLRPMTGTVTALGPGTGSASRKRKPRKARRSRAGGKAA